MEIQTAEPVRVFGFLMILAVLVCVFLMAVVFIAVIKRNFQHWVSLRKQAAHRSSCPSSVRLKAFLEAKTPDQEISDHVETCERCQDRLDLLLAAREPWSAKAFSLGGSPATQDLALKRAMEDLKADAPKEAPHAAPPPSNGDALDFLSPSDQPGHLGRLGHYEVLEVIGRGGMGVVLKAFDPGLHRVVAIKVLAPQLATSGTARKRFTREAQAAAAVTHDHVVTIHAVSEANGVPYLVMHYVAGQSLQERLDKSGPLELKEILRIGMQTAAGLAAAHAQGLVHRDIKPANILLENGVQRVKITDFGLARAADDASLTQSGTVAGTPQYMAPEQTRGELVDHRADLFSLGSVLYAMCTGRPPFCASTTMAVLRRVSDETPRSIKELNPEIPDWLVALVDKLHAKDPADRFQSAGEVAESLNQHLAQLQQAAWTPLPGGAAEKAPRPLAAAEAPITSLTICPSCGSHLHVPDKMVGPVVNCPQCGKPFQVQDGSQEIQVIQIAPHPVLHLARVQPKHPFFKTGPIWTALAIFFLLGFGFIALLLVVYLLRWGPAQEAREAATVVELAPHEMPAPAPIPMPPRTVPTTVLQAKLDKARAIPDAGQRDDALFNLVQEAVQNDESIMKAALQEIRNDAQHDGAAQACVYFLLAHGQNAQAREVAKEIRDPDRRGAVLRKVQEMGG